MFGFENVRKVSLDELGRIKATALELKKLCDSKADSTIMAVVESVKNITDIILRCTDCLQERQFWIEYHFSELKVPLEIHELYHACSINAVVEARRLFQESKTLLNYLTSLLPFVITHTHMRGVKTKSFGSFLNPKVLSLLLTHDNQEIRAIAKVYNSKGNHLDSTVCEYRDKFIEHAQPPDLGLLSTAPGTYRIAHGPNRFFTSPLLHTDKESNEELKNHFVDIVKLISKEDGTDTLYVHLKPKSTLDLEAKKGEPIGEVSDSSGLHFKKYGRHHHFFPHNSLVTETYCVAPIEPFDSAVSPDIIESYFSLMDFVNSVLTKLVRYKKRES